MAEPGPAEGVNPSVPPKLLSPLALTPLPRKILFVVSTHESDLAAVLESLHTRVCVRKPLLFILQRLSRLSVCVSAYSGKGAVFIENNFFGMGVLDT